MIRNNQNGRRRGRGGARPPQAGGGPSGNYGNANGGGSRIDTRQRGNATQLLDKYKAMARDASQNGDRVQAEFYMQYADHYYRVVNEFRARDPQPAQRPTYDDDDAFNPPSPGAVYSQGGRDDDDDDAREAATGDERGAYPADRGSAYPERRNGNGYAGNGRASAYNGAERTADSGDARPRDDREPRREPDARRRDGEPTRDGRPRDGDIARPRYDVDRRDDGDVRPPRTDYTREPRSDAPRAEPPRNDTPRERAVRSDQPRNDQTRERAPREPRFDRRDAPTDDGTLIAGLPGPATVLAAVPREPQADDHEATAIPTIPAFTAEATDAVPAPRKRGRPRKVVVEPTDG